MGKVAGFCEFWLRNKISINALVFDNNLSNQIVGIY